MDFSRIRSVLDTDRLAQSSIVLIGTGAAKGLAENLVRCGVGTITLIDPDCVGPENLTRQSFFADQIGQPKALATAHDLERIYPECHIKYLQVDFTEFDDNRVVQLFADADLLILATDSFPCQARGNQVALLTETPAIFVGGSARGAAGEVIWTTPELAPCYRCIAPTRFAAAEQGLHRQQRNEPASSGVTAFDMALVDSIAGQIALGILTKGADNRFGRLVEQLEDRQFVQIKIDPTWTLGKTDVIRQRLGIAEDCRDYFSWNSIVRNDPDQGLIPCPDCARYRGTQFYYQRLDAQKVLGRAGATEPVPLEAVHYNFETGQFLDGTTIEECVQPQFDMEVAL